MPLLKKSIFWSEDEVGLWVQYPDIVLDKWKLQDHHENMSIQKYWIFTTEKGNF